MKLLLLCLLVFPMVAVAQFKNRPYYKISPALHLVKKSDPLPAMLVGFGGQLNRYATLGAIGGYFKLDGYKRGIIPIGLDLTVTDYGKHKIQPVFVMQAFFPIYEEVYRTGGAAVTIKGRFMMSANAGISLPLKNKHKLLLTGGYSQLVLRSNIKNQPRTVIELVPVSLTVMF